MHPISSPSTFRDEDQGQNGACHPFRVDQAGWLEWRVVWGSLQKTGLQAPLKLPWLPFGPVASEGVQCPGRGSSLTGFLLHLLPFKAAPWHLCGYLELVPWMKQGHWGVACGCTWVGSACSSQTRVEMQPSCSSLGVDVTDTGAPIVLRRLSTCNCHGHKALNPCVLGSTS